MSSNNEVISFLNIPDNLLPKCWTDTNRLNVLFAPFREKQLNPIEWDSKYTEWKHLISLYASHNKMFSFTLLHLEKAFTRNKLVPSCLPTVFEELKREGILVKKEDFMKQASVTWVGYFTDVLVTRPLTWSFNKIKSSLINPQNTFVHIPTVHDEAMRLLSCVDDSYKHKLIDVMQLLSLVEKHNFTHDNVQIILHYLNCQKKISLKQRENSSITLIKLSNSEIDENEINVYFLEDCERKLQDEIKKMEEKSLSLIKEAKKHKTSGNKRMALISLKRKHENETRIVQKYNSLQNIQHLLCSLEDAQMNIKIKDSYKKALDTLKDVNTSLTFDEIDEIIANIEEEVTDQNNISKTISAPLSDSFTDEELEKELDDLLNDGNDNKNASEELKELEEQMESLKLPKDMVEEKKTVSLNTKVPTV